VQSKILQIRGRGTVTLPVRSRERYRLQDGDPLTFIDLDGVMLLAPRVGVVWKLAAEIEKSAREVGLTPDELVEGVRQERHRSSE
jgi:bifunctional DNA-binding transcriptional regulator/antitoxin component of YhaV-PrlF toxin-antitoxin module